jgi:hypothetical protein
MNLIVEVEALRIERDEARAERDLLAAKVEIAAIALQQMAETIASALVKP